MNPSILIPISIYPHKGPKGRLTGLYLQIRQKLHLGLTGYHKRGAIIQFLGVGSHLYLTLKVPSNINYLLDVATALPTLPGGFAGSLPLWRGAIKGYRTPNGAVRFYIPYTFFKKPIPPLLKVTTNTQASIFKYARLENKFILMEVPFLKRSYFNQG